MNLMRLALPLLLVSAQSAQATQTKSLAEYTAEISQQLRSALSKQDLRKDGALDPFLVIKHSGLVRVSVLFPVYSTDGGGQNGAFARVNKKTNSLDVSFTNTWVHAVSSVYCLPSAVVEKQTSPDNKYFAIAPGQDNQCIEIAAVSKDMGLDHLSLDDSYDDRAGMEAILNQYDTQTERDAAFASIHADRVTPEFRISMSVRNGKLAIENLPIEGRVRGRYKQAIYIWNRGVVTDGGRDEQSDRTNDIRDQIENETLAPVAVIDQGLISQDELLKAVKGVEWAAYAVPSIHNTDIAKARASLSTLSPATRADGEKVIAAIESYQLNRQKQREAGERDGLYGTAEFKALEKACAEVYKRERKYDSKPECNGLRAQRDQLFKMKRANATYVNFETEMQKSFPVIDGILDRLVSNADKDPSIVSFLIEIQPAK